MADPIGFVSPPVRHPRRGGIKTVADFVPAERMFAGASIQWTSEPCDFPLDLPGLCWGEEVVDPNKTTGGITTDGTGPIFGLYKGVECYMLGNDEDYKARATRALEQGEDRGLERKLAAWLATLDPSFVTYADLPTAISQAEQYADANYLGRPTLIMSRSEAVLAVAALVLANDQQGNIWTPNGTPVLATSALSEGDPIYITGNLTVYTSVATAQLGTNLAGNRELAIAERAYAFGLDCGFIAAVAVEGGVEPFGIELASVPESETPTTTPIDLTATTTVEATGVILMYRVNGEEWGSLGAMSTVDNLSHTYEFDPVALDIGDVLDFRAVHDETSNTVTITIVA